MATASELDLTNKHIVIVGGASGIGKATAQLAVMRGAMVTVSSRSQSKLEQAVAELGQNASALPVDLVDEASVREWANTLGPIDHLIITASSVTHGPFAESLTDDLRAMIESKFLGPMVMVREALPKMKDNGSIILFSGVLSRRPGKGAVGLGAVNAGVEGLVRGLALELGPNVRVNGISPGMTDTEAYEHLPQERRDAMFKDTAARLPLDRIGSAMEIAEATLHAATATFMTGHVLDVDGGHLVRQ